MSTTKRTGTNTEGKPYLDAGLQYLRVSEEALLQRIAAEPKLLRLPLIRCGNLLSVGQDEAAWKTMLPAPSHLGR